MPTHLAILRNDRKAQVSAVVVAMWVVLSATVGFGASWRTPALTIAFAGITALVVLGGAAAVLVRAAAVRGLHARGRAVVAHVAEVDAKRSGTARVTYEVDGAPFEARVLAGRYRVGDTVAMLDDPRDPSRATVRLA
ncbi:MAG: hypothetical protein U0414_15215 [Polyangiaceae bacterium]